MKALLCAFITMLVAVYAKDATTTSHGVTVQFLGQSGKMKVYQGESNLEISFDKLVEVDGDKEVGSGINMASQEFVWSTPITVFVNGANTTKIAFNATFSNGAKLEVISWVYHQTGSVTSGNKTVTVQRDHVKFSVLISSWPFAKDSNKLSFGCEVKFKGGNGKFADKMEKGKDSSKTVVGPGTIDVLDTAIVDGVSTQITPTLVTKGAYTGIAFLFPKFDNQVDYDPVFGLNNSALSVAAEPRLLVALLALAVFLAKQ